MSSLFSFLRNSLITATLAMSASPAYAAPKDELFDPYNAPIEENIRVPEVPRKSKAAVIAAMHNLRRTFQNENLQADLVRSGEVVMVTLPCDRLFAPNSTELRTEASVPLRTLLPYIKRADNYKVVIAVHSDNTGDSIYTDRITADRAAAIDDFYSRENGGAETGIIPYGIGDDEPVAPNTGIRNRAANRRVEFYFIPTLTFISKAKK